MITLQQQIKAVQKQITHLKHLRDKNGLDFDETITELTAVKRTLRQLESIAKGME